MFILGLNGSPDKKGNTYYLLSKVMEKTSNMGALTQIIDVGDFVASSKGCFCTACTNPCTGICYKGTKLEEAFNLMRKADAIILGSPVYFGTVSAQLKAFFDKSRILRGEKALYNKIGAGITVGAAKYGGQETTMRALHDIMLVQGMIIIGDGYIDNDCGHHGVSSQKPSCDDEFAINRVEILANRLVEVCNATKNLRK